MGSVREEGLRRVASALLEVEIETRKNNLIFFINILQEACLIKIGHLLANFLNLASRTAFLFFARRLLLPLK